jgi:protein O-mannosyl-transferase
MNSAPNAAVNADSRGPAGGWRVLAVAAVLMLAAVGAYWNSFNVPFLLDDAMAIDDNPSIRHLGRIREVLSPPPIGPTAARPLLNLTFAVNFAADDVSVRGYHVVNLLIHICAGLALLGIVRHTLLLPGLCQRYGEAALPLAAFAALIWTLHPLQTEAVTYISQRAESLMGLFYLLTLYCFIRSVTAESRNCWLILSVAACLCGMATKQVMVTAPVLVLLYDRAFVSGSFRSALASRRWYYASLAVTWLWLGFLIHHSSLTAVGAGFQAGVSWLTYALTELRVVTEYVKLVLWPHPLVFDYGTEIMATDPLTAVPFALIIAALLVGVAIVWRKSPPAGFLGVWFFLILAPSSTVVPIAAQPMAESRMYLPLAGVIVLVTLLSYEPGRRRAFVVLAIVAVGLGVLTARRNHDYRSEVSIWEDTLATHPYSSRAHCQLGMAFAKIPGQLPAAITQYEEAVRLKPDFVDARNNLAVHYAEIGRLDAAIEQMEIAARLNPASTGIRYNLEKMKARRTQ